MDAENVEEKDNMEALAHQGTMGTPSPRLLGTLGTTQGVQKVPVAETL